MLHFEIMLIYSEWFSIFNLYWKGVNSKIPLTNGYVLLFFYKGALRPIFLWHCILMLCCQFQVLQQKGSRMWGLQCNIGLAVVLCLHTELCETLLSLPHLSSPILEYMWWAVEYNEARDRSVSVLQLSQYVMRG